MIRYKRLLKCKARWEPLQDKVDGQTVTLPWKEHYFVYFSAKPSETKQIYLISSAHHRIIQNDRFHLITVYAFCCYVALLYFSDSCNVLGWNGVGRAYAHICWFNFKDRILFCIPFWKLWSKGLKSDSNYWWLSFRKMLPQSQLTSTKCD